MKETTIINAIRNATTGALLSAKSMGYMSGLSKNEREEIREKVDQWKASVASLRAHAFQWFLLNYNRQDATEEANKVYATYKEILRQAEISDEVRADGETLYIMAAFSAGNDKWNDERTDKLPTPCSDDMFRGKVERFIIRELDKVEVRDFKEYDAIERAKKQKRKEEKEAKKAIRESKIDTFRAEIKPYMEEASVEIIVKKARKECKNNDAVQELLDSELKKAKEAYNKAA